MTAQPATYNNDLAHLPPALLPLTLKERWVCWKWVERTARDGSTRWTKPPYEPRWPDQPARNNDPSTWGSYQDAIISVRAGKADGIGYMLSGDDLNAGDLDHCRDPATGMIDPWARDIIGEAAALDAYYEATVSGTGLRFLGLGSGSPLHRRLSIPNAQADAGFEAYRGCERYITISGLELSQCARLPDLGDLLVRIVARIEGQNSNGAAQAPNLSGFDLNAAGPQFDIETILIKGVPKGGRSEAFMQVVVHYARQGLSLDEIVALLEANPNGIMEKYAGRVRAEVRRCLKNARIALVPTSSASSAPGASAGAQAASSASGASSSSGTASASPGPAQGGIGSNSGLRWDSVNARTGAPDPTRANVRIALQLLGLKCSFDTFHNKLLIKGAPLGPRQGEVSDNVCLVAAHLISDAFRFEPKIEPMRSAVIQLCEENRFDPVVGYLDALQWDAKPRIDTWTIDYLSAEPTELNRATGRLFLIAGVRRPRHPGTKFDTILTLEGVEGTLKSSALRALAGDDESFSDQTILGVSEQRQQENMAGRWIYECADLSGMRKTEIEQVKAFASRQIDRGRPVYGHFSIDQPRRGIVAATTNDDTYLKSQTGNRRFWPTKTGLIKLDLLIRDRDQLWAEAAHLEAQRASVTLPEYLWPEARREQDKRLERDPWSDILAGVIGAAGYQGANGEDEERISSRELMTDVLEVPKERQTDTQLKRLGNCMRKLGWIGPKVMRIGSKAVSGYARALSARPDPLEEGDG